ncbi:MAG TPA: hypothetical protein VMY37_15255 [Thermoguttaceae bacterium]|nr:hypothetical protein [Thermoguttaceae bacterium]
MIGKLHGGLWLLAGATFVLTGCTSEMPKPQRMEAARAQVNRWADQLDAQTTETGVYVRPTKEQLEETDPWGKPLMVSYTQDGLSETLVVRSAGPDGRSHTADDVTAQRMAANLKGIGEGVKKNVATVAQEASRGAVRGIIQGVKEAVQDARAAESRDQESPDAVNAPKEEGR